MPPPAAPSSTRCRASGRAASPVTSPSPTPATRHQLEARVRLPGRRARRSPRAGTATTARAASTSPSPTPSWNGNLGTGATTSIGFNGTFGSANPMPTAFTLNGTACNGAAAAPTVPISRAGRRTPVTPRRRRSRSPPPPRRRPAARSARSSSTTTACCSTPTPRRRTRTPGPACRPSAATTCRPRRTTTGQEHARPDVPVFVDASTAPAIVADAVVGDRHRGRHRDLQAGAVRGARPRTSPWPSPAAPAPPTCRPRPPR